jgi:hypothetical protein
MQWIVTRAASLCGKQPLIFVMARRFAARHRDFRDAPNIISFYFI